VNAIHLDSLQVDIQLLQDLFFDGLQCIHPTDRILARSNRRSAVFGKPEYTFYTRHPGRVRCLSFVDISVVIEVVL